MTLTREEELQLVARAKAGDREAMVTLWDAFKGLAWQAARKRADQIPGVDPDDLAQEGFLGMAKAVRAFDPARGTRFATAAWWYVRREIGAHLRSRGGRPLPQDPPDLPARGESPSEALATDDDSSAGAMADENRVNVRELVRTLPQNEREVVELFYGLNDGPPLSLIEAAEVLSVSPNGVSQRLARARQRLRETCGCPAAA